MPVDPRRPDPVRGRRGPRSAGFLAPLRVGGAKGGELSAASSGLARAAGAAPGQLTCAAGNRRGELVSNLRWGRGPLGTEVSQGPEGLDTWARLWASPRGMKRGFQEIGEPQNVSRLERNLKVI